MSAQLFEEVFMRAQSRYLDPGDQVRARHKATNRQKTPRREKERCTKNDRKNKWRQPVAHEWETDFRHGKWQQHRTRRRHALVAAGTPTAALDRWDNCGAECMIEWSEEAQRHRLKASFCHSRHCEPCARTRAGLITNNLRTKLTAVQKERPQQFKFMAFTLKHSRMPYAAQLKRLYACFRKLRSTPIWKLTQRGGAAMLETKIGDDGLWHPHLHIVGEGDFISKERLCKEWHKITGDSYIADIKVIKTQKDAAYYVTKYITKGAPETVWSDPARAREYVEAMKGVRVCLTYGTWRGYALLKIDPANTCKDWKPVMLLTELVRRAGSGDIAAADQLHFLYDSLTYDPHRKRQRQKPSD